MLPEDTKKRKHLQKQPSVERAHKLVCENSCDREGDCKGGRMVGGELPEAAERTHELVESKEERENACQASERGRERSHDTGEESVGIQRSRGDKVREWI
jgi:hypothetical protein